MRSTIIYSLGCCNRFGGWKKLVNAEGCPAAIQGCLVAVLSRSGFISPLTNCLNIGHCARVLSNVMLSTLSLLVYGDLVLTEGGRGSLDHNQGWKVIPFSPRKYSRNGIAFTARPDAPKKRKGGRKRPHDLT